MDLSKLAASTLSNFDAKKDNVNGQTELPAGTYNTILEQAEHRIYDSGYDCLMFVLTVIDGKYVGRKEFVRASLATKKKDGTDMPDFVVSKNIKLIAKLAAQVGLAITPDMFAGNETDCYEKISKALYPYKGKPLTTIISESPNKKDPSNPYRNYDFGPAKQTMQMPTPEQFNAAVPTGTPQQPTQPTQPTQPQQSLSQAPQGFQWDQSLKSSDDLPFDFD
ncbi:hypothetical protein HCY81_01710 [Limosilactobacillus fermentum]